MSTAPTSPTVGAITPDVDVLQEVRTPENDTIPDKISAYYSLSFPSSTYYLQTLTVTIGRRSVRPGVASSSASPEVDVDLGPLKSVSRLHARIEYEENQERFVLVVLGRNGAWVDGIWSGSGSRVPLGARSQIQIATRVFHFILPPPPAPEDSPSPSSPSSTNRHLSPSIDITSLSPASSFPSPSAIVTDLPPVHAPKPPHPIPNGKRQTKLNGKKRKKPGAPEQPAPEITCPRPDLTFAQLCYRAIKALHGKASLGEINHWVSQNYEWYRLDGTVGWENSIRHNLSGNDAFKKLERCAGKGYFWGIDSRYEKQFEEEVKPSGAAAPGPKEVGKGKTKGVKGGTQVEPPLKRSVKGDAKQPLPPPLTSTPLPAFSTASANAINTGPTVTSSSGAAVKVEAGAVSSSLNGPALQRPEEPPAAPPANGPNSLPSLPPDVIVPIVIGPPQPANETDADASGAPFDLSSPPIALHGDTIILNPVVFASLTPEQLKEIEALGARKAIEILQSHIVRFLKERRKTKADGTRVKGRKKAKGTKAKKEDGVAAVATEGTPKAEDAPGQAQPPVTKTKAKIDTSSGPFTTTPLAFRKAPPPPAVPIGAQPSTDANQPAPSSNMASFQPAMPGQAFVPPMAHLEGFAEESIEVDIVGDNSSGAEEPAAKRRRTDPLEMQT